MVTLWIASAWSKSTLLRQLVHVARLCCSLRGLQWSRDENRHHGRQDTRRERSRSGERGPFDHVRAKFIVVHARVRTHVRVDRRNWQIHVCLRADVHAECASRRYKSLENTLESRSTRLDALNTVMGEMRLKVECGDARVNRRRGGETAERNGDKGRGREIVWEEAENEEKVLVKERFTFSGKLEGTE